MNNPIRCLIGFVFAAIVIVVPLCYAAHTGAQLRNFHVVTDDVLYRSGQMTLKGLQQVIHEHGIKSVVSLRDSIDPKDSPPDREEELYCKGQDIAYCRIPPRTWWPAADGTIPATKGTRKFLEIMDDPNNYPVLIHCFAGVHRTGAFCAVYRMEFEHWSNADAIAEVRACGYKNLDDEVDLLGFLEEYQPRWQAAHTSLRPQVAKPALYKTVARHKRPSRPRSE